jgi:mRNA-degrading endonuclease HigB of HigAB toxin-antitoxin module
MRIVRNILLVACSCSWVFVNGQDNIQVTQLTHYIFDSFRKGKVLMKNGEENKQLLNYSVLNNEMVFDAGGGKYLAISQPEKVDTVFIEDRKFIPKDNAFFEVLAKGPVPLLLEYTCTVKEPGSDIGYGMKSTTSGANSLKSLMQSTGAFAMKLPDGYEIIPGYSYWLVKDGKLEKAGSAKQITSVFPDKKDALKDWVKKNNTDFKKREDIIALVEGIQQ